MTHGSLFSGIGGFDLASEWMGWENLFHCEMNPFGQKVLNHYWPDAELFTDITKSDFTKYANRIDILTGGFPCQPYSHAGKRLGKEDERHLWPSMLRAIREIQPSWVVGENVSGLISWDGGLVFDEVQTDLEAEGYEVWPVVLPAASVGAPHRRDRIFFIAYSKSNNAGRKQSNNIKRQDIAEIGGRFQHESSSNGINRITPDAGLQRQAERQKQPMGIEQLCEKQPTPNPAYIGHEPSRGTWAGRAGFTDGDTQATPKANSGRQSGKEYRQEESGWIAEKSLPGNWQNFPTQSPICGRNDGIPNRLDGITFSKWRNESIKAYGNAIVPQVAYQIFKAIKQLARCNSNIEL